MSAAALGGWEPVRATGSGTFGILAAAERVQQLQALVAQVERHPSAGTFASALGAAQAGDTGSTATATANYPAMPTVGDADTSATPLANAYPSAAPTTYNSTSPADAYTSATPADAYTSAAPTTIAYTSAAPSPAGPNAAGTGTAYTPLIAQAAARYGLDPAVLHGLIQQESGFDPSARSSAGALGLTQLMPGTASSLGVSEPLNPTQSIEGGARYLSQLLQQFGGNTADALAAYNAGPGAVQQYGGVPPYPETQQYVTKVLGYAASYSQSEGSSAPYIGTAIPSADVIDNAGRTTSGVIA